MLKYTLYFIMFWLLISCNKESSTEPTVGHDPALVGTWTIVSASLNGNNITPDSLQAVPVKLILNVDGSGYYWLEDYGFPSENDTLGWSTSGNQITFADAFTGTYSVSGNTMTLSYTDANGQKTIVFSKQGGPINNSPLVGTWNLTTLKVNNQIINPDSVEEVPSKIQFNADGTGKVWMENYGNLTHVDTFSWSASGNQLTIINDFTGTYSVVGNIFTMSYQEVGAQVEMIFIRQTGISQYMPYIDKYYCILATGDLNA